jgi:hypothetical protein
MSWRRNGNEWSGVIRNHQEKKKFKTTPSAGKLMITVFCEIDGVILVDVMVRGATINSDAYIKTLQKLKQRYRRLRPNRNPETCCFSTTMPALTQVYEPRRQSPNLDGLCSPIPPIVLIWRRQISIFLGH